MIKSQPQSASTGLNWPHPQPLSKGRGEWYALCIDRLLLANSSTNNLVNSSTPQPFVHFSNSRQLVNWSTCQLVHSLTCQLVNSSTYLFCPFFSKSFNIMAAVFSTNRPPRRKKSILARVGLVQTGECLRMRKNEYLLPRIVFYTRFWVICSKM